MSDYLKLTQLSSLEKVFLNRPITDNEYIQGSMLLDEEFSYQIAYQSNITMYFDVAVSSPIKDNITLYAVENVPVELTGYNYNEKDDNYITFEPGLFPDVLNEIKDGKVISFHRNKSLWVNIKTDKNTKPGTYPITIIFKRDDGTICEERTFTIEVIGAVLPEQKLTFTQWFHGDCIASYYGVEMLSEEHWKQMESFVKMAAEHGINMILTPIFTPPLDTEIGGERPTIQLVDVYLENGKYSFGFENLKRWINMCKKCGIKYFEMSHLFTQWGAKCTPKIVAEVDGEKKKIFGWETSATSPEYKEFLGEFLPQLTDFLKAEGISQNTYFHISDEPFEDQLESYTAACEIVKPYLKEFKIIDALSSFELYQRGVAENPIPALIYIDEFLGIDNLWTYYCCAEGFELSNRFLAMPSARNRIIGIQLFKYKVKGFLQWGYNFYYSCNSRRLINPYRVTDADAAFPAGDAFSVYPGDDGEAVASLRLKVFLHALQDMRAMEMLEPVIGRDEIVKLIDKYGEVTFRRYPKNEGYILELREKLNELIKEYCIK